MIEDALVEVRAALRTNLAAALDAEDTQYSAADAAEFGAAIVLEDVASASYRFEDFEELEIQNLPAIMILPRGTQSVPFMSSVTRLKHTVEIWLVVIDTNPVKLARRLFRTAEAVRRVVSQYVESAGAEPGVFQTDFVNADYSPSFEFEDGGLGKAAVLTFELHEIEDRP